MTNQSTTVSVAFEGRPVARHRGPRVVQQLVGDQASIAFIRDAILLTSELVTAATDDCDRCELNASFDGEQLRVEVRDLPASTPACWSDRRDLEDGLRLVNRMASSWGAKPNGSRAMVWFELTQQIYRRHSLRGSST